MTKKISFNEDARKAIKSGLDQLANAVKVTLGPKGRTVIIERSYGGPLVTKDGVTVAKEIELEDKMENLGASLMKEVASKTADVAGDGTTTATVLAQAMVDEGTKFVAAGIDPQGLRRGIELAVETAVREIKHMAKPVAGEAIKQVASISANDKEIGETIAEAMAKVGDTGVITIEEGQSFGIEVEIVEGLQFDKGYLSHYMVTSPERAEAQHSNVPILVTDQKISSAQTLLPILEMVAKTGQTELVIVAEDVDAEALSFLVVNRLRGTFNALAIKAAGFGDRKKALLEDLAVITGATLISEELGGRLDSVELKHLGRARKVVSTKETTTVVDGYGTKEAIEEQAGRVKQQISTATNPVERESLQERLAKLVGGIGVIKVGAASEVEMKEKKHRIEDAVSATKAAVEEGIVPGGGVALIRIQPMLTALSDKLRAEGKTAESYGAIILAHAVESPLRQIALNAGVEGAVIVERVKKGSGNMGWNALIMEDEDDMVLAGIIDPAKVTRNAIQNASSIASMVLSTEVAVVNIESELQRV